jgi:hypothetical protein
VAVGAQGENAANGAVHIFHRTSEGRWQRQSHLALKTDHGPALFGWSVALSGRTLMVGAFGENSFTGAAYLFQQGDAGTWTQLGRLVPDSPRAAYQCFGFSVAVTLYGALIGQPCDGEGGQQVTRAYLFSRDPSGAWSRRTAVTSPRAPSTANFGASLATNGIDVVMGSPSEAPGGAAYVIECLACLLYGEQP